MYMFFISAIGFLLTNYCIFKILPFLRSSFIDVPNDRSSHLSPTPSGAGISFVLVSLILSPLLKTKLIYLSFPLAILGFIDDKYLIPSKVRYVFQLITGVLLIIFSPNFYYLNDFTIINALFLFVFLLFSITGFINFTNFMDGIDGLVAGCMIIMLLFGCIINSINLFPLVACLIAFILWNWNPAKVFMGDSGSTFLGAIYCGIILNSNNLNDAISIILVGIPLWADAFTCVIRRAYNRQRIFSAHRLHLYQRLNQAGWSHELISSTYIFLSLILSLIYLVLGLKFLIITSFLVFLLGIFIDHNFATPFNQKTN